MADPGSVALTLPALGSDGVALVVGAATTWFDHYSKLTVDAGRLPVAFRSNWIVLSVSAGCGLIAAGACAYSAAYPGVFSTVLTLNAGDPWRGFTVGASVLILLRSKLLNIQDSPFGGDFLYRFFQTTAIQDVNDRWSATKSAFKARNIVAALGILTFENDVETSIGTWIQSRPDGLQKIVGDKLKLLKANRPAGAFDGAALAWRIYYLGLLDVALHAAGPSQVARAFPGTFS